MGLIFLSYLHHLNGEDGGLLHTKVEKIFRRPIFHSIFAPPVQSFAADGVYSADTYDTRARKMKEQELSERCREGDRDAWHELYDRYGGRLLALCMRYAGSRAAAEDLMHDAFLKIVDSIERFAYRGEGSLRAWIERVTVNLAIERLRRDRRQPLFAPLDDETMRTADDEPTAEEVDRIPQQELLRLVAELPEGYRTIFNLYCMEGRSHREIALLLGIREKSSSSQLARARALLATRIKAYKKQEA